MKKSVKITIDKKTSYLSPFDITETTTVLELKTIIKDSFKFPYEIVNETLWGSSTELKDEDVLPKTGRLEYVLSIK